METPGTGTRDALSRRVIRLVAEQAALTEEGIELDSSFMADLNYDSLDVVEFIMKVEEEFDLTLPDDVADRITTVRQAIEEIRKLV